MELLKKALFIAKTRPWEVAQRIRGWWLFCWTRWRMKWTRFPNINLGRNVRVQSSSCLRAEPPAATISLGDHSIIYENARLEAYGQGNITIGSFCILGDIRLFARNHIEFGDYVITSWNVFVQDFDPHPLDANERHKQIGDYIDRFLPRFDSYVPASQPSIWTEFASASITVGNNVWLGANVTLLKGAHIGDHCVVGASAVVGRGYYPPYSLIVGNPARVAKTLTPRSPTMETTPQIKRSPESQP